MAITALTGPVIAFGQSASGGDSNPDMGPSMFWGGAATLDPRYPFTYNPGEAQSGLDFGWLGFDSMTTINNTPYTASATAVVASANPTSANLALALTGSATTGVAVIPSLTRADTGILDTGVNGLGFLGIDCFQSVTASITLGVMTVTANAALQLSIGSQILTTGAITNGALLSAGQPTTIVSQVLGAGNVGTYLLSNSTLSASSGTVTAQIFPAAGSSIAFGNPSSVSLWNPSAMIARALSVTAAAGATYTTATISGYDIYGYPMVEAIPLTAGGTANGKKAWKYVRSVVLSGGTADTTHAYSVGTLDIYGFPIRSDQFSDMLISYSASLNPVPITSATGYTAAILVTPTATTGDVRGTYALQVPAATGANRLFLKQSPQPYNIGVTVPTSASGVGLFGIPHFANF